MCGIHIAEGTLEDTQIREIFLRDVLYGKYHAQVSDAVREQVMEQRRRISQLSHLIVDGSSLAL